MFPQKIHNFQYQKYCNTCQMAQANSMYTPIKPLQQTRKIPDTTDQTPEQLFMDTQGKVDYKNKTFKLMKQLTQLQVINKKSYNQIRQLESEVQAFKRQFDKIFKSLGVRNLQQAYKKIEDVLRGERKNMNEIKLAEWSNIVEQYKKIINTQQYKFIKLQQQLKIAEVKIKKYEQNAAVQPKEMKQIKQKKNQQKERQEIKAQILKQHQDEMSKIKSELTGKDKQIQSLNQELSILKKQYKQLLIERQNIKDMYEELQNKYNEEIQHFEEMEKHVEERLLEVEREMNFYRFEREGHIEKIELMRQQLNLKQTKNFFSFGGVKNQQVQTDFEQDSSPFNSECMEISIKTLLQQNNKLKNNLLILYTRKPEEELPKEIELQLKILLNMHDASIKFKKEQAKQQVKQQVSKQAQLRQSQNKAEKIVSLTTQQVSKKNKIEQPQKAVEIQQVKEQ